MMPRLHLLPQRHLELLSILLVGIVAFLVYANSLANTFTLDDFPVFLNNPAFFGSPLHLFSTIDTVNETQLLPYYRPLTYLTYFAERQLHGFNPFAIRLLNVFLHVLNAVLVFRLARTLFRDQLPASLLVGLLFAAHPILTEGVNFNAGGRNTMLSCLFTLSAYLLHHHAVNRARALIATSGAILFFAGLLSKETTMMILPLIVAREFSASRSIASVTWRPVVFRLFPYGIAAFGYLWLRGATLMKYGIQSGLLPEIGSKLLESRYVTDDLLTRLLHNIYIIPRYLYAIVNPTTLAPRYDIPGDLHLLALPLAGSWLIIITALIWLFTRGRSPATLFGLSWMVLFWIPISGITIIPIPLADRYLYLPIIGFWIVTADQLTRALQPTSPRTRTVAIAGVVVTMCVLAGVSVRRNLDWRNDRTLFTRFVAQYPESHHAYFGLGHAYTQNLPTPQPELAEQAFEKSLALYAMNRNAHRQLGNLLLNRGELNGALAHYSEAIAMFPQDREARINRGITYEKLGRLGDALADYRYYLALPGPETLPQARIHAEERLRELTRR